MSRSLMSSANLPRPRNKRSSSLRGSAAPTQPPLPFFFSLSATIFGASANISRARAPAPHELSERCLQPVDQFLNLFPAQRFEQATGYRRQAAEDLGFTLPVHFGSECGHGWGSVCRSEWGSICGCRCVSECGCGCGSGRGCGCGSVCGCRCGSVCDRGQIKPSDHGDVFSADGSDRKGGV